jgi:hypothetical protein
MVEIAGVRVMDGVLPLPPAIGREQQEAEEVAPTAVHAPRLEHRVVGEVVEEGIHAGEEDGRDEAEGDRDRGTRLDEEGHDPDGEVGDDGARDLSQAAPLVGLEVGSEVLLPGAAVGDLRDVHDHSLRRAVGDGSADSQRMAASSVK